MTRKVSSQLLRHTHIHAENGTHRKACGSEERVSVQPAIANSPVATRTKSALGPRRDPRVLIERPHAMDNLQIAPAHQAANLRTFAVIPAAHRRLHLEDDLISLKPCRSRSGLVDKTSERADDDELASRKLDRSGPCRAFLQGGNLVNAFIRAEREYIDPANGQLAPSEYENDVQVPTRQRYDRDTRSHANEVRRSLAVAYHGHETWQRQSTPEVSSNRSATKIAYPGNKEQIARTPASRAVSCTQGDVRIARTLELGRCFAGGLPIIGDLAR